MKNVRLCAVLVVCLVLCVFSGCGYTTRAYIGPYKTIYIAPFKNNIDIASARSELSNFVNYFPLLENDITSAVVDRFIFDGNLKVVKEEEADVIIRGELTVYNRGALGYAQNNEDVTEYRVTLTSNIEFYNNKTKKTIWRKDGFAGDSTYFTTGAQSLSEREALDNAVTDLARRIVEAVVEAW